MAIIALVAGKGAPGVTTSALAMTLGWPGPALLVEADPAGSDVVAGYLRGQAPSGRGLVQLAVASRRDGFDVGAQLLDIGSDKASRYLLPGITDPAQAATVATIWAALAAHLARGRSAHQPLDRTAPTGGSVTATGGVPDDPLADRDIVVDSGRLGGPHAPWPLIDVADVVAVVVRPTLRAVSAARPAVAALRAATDPAGTARIGLIVVDEGEYRTGEVARALDVPILGTLLWRPKEAAALSDGCGRISDGSPLVRRARDVAAATLAWGGRADKPAVQHADTTPRNPWLADAARTGVGPSGMTVLRAPSVEAPR